MDLFRRPNSTLRNVVASNESLRHHPFVQAAFVGKGCRDVKFGRGDAEFSALYEAAQHAAKEEDKHIWQYPPDLQRMETVEYWLELGLNPEGVMFKCLQDR